ncbi:helix-turn-helix transcriptional regulator [Pseudonocardia sp. KRD291]|uniref:helix-turn-helix transcriptional regulator n=1 Tax=Pseudonocardia sp. KRD291 TaxID=2792007 RepID=UPI001C4A36D1|nr:helix-turn-helix transcriptional regulator [Pseudonocardia sp. KRD291]MBW0106878.1 helix-turn-helix domain-containing protein [Pseudonocardia sp. KRD291]
MDRDELGTMLRTWRERVHPADVGLPAGARRRTPGLRREEVAGLAGMSVDYLSRLEQGRGPHPSEAVLGAMARALRLETPERDHLFHLAGVAPPTPGQIGTAVRPSVLRLIDRFADLPAVLLNVRRDVLAWNPMAAALFGDFSADPPARRNLLRSRFLTGDSRMVAHTAEDRARLDRSMIGDLRGTVARYPQDQALRRLVADLCAGSETFARIWAEREVIAHHGDRKTFAHPQVGELTLDCDALHVSADDQTLLVYSAAPGSPAADGLSLLRVVGTQELRTGS